MNEAERARANAIPLEVKKDGLRQRQSGDWVLSLVIAAVHMDQRLTAAAMGTLYECALVELNGDGTARDHKMEARDKWQSIGPTKQAGIRCSDPVFWAWLEEAHHYSVNDSEAAAAAVRDFCGVLSRREFEQPGKQMERLRWYELDNQFQAWRVLEHG